MINPKEKSSNNNKEYKKQAILMGSIFFILTISIGTIDILNQIAYAEQGEEANQSKSEMMTMMMPTSSKMPQPNSNSTILEVEGSNALFEPAVGLTNVFGPEGIFPFTDVFKCADALTCGYLQGKCKICK
jgi:hypothetical protein